MRYKIIIPGIITLIVVAGLSILLLWDRQPQPSGTSGNFSGTNRSEAPSVASTTTAQAQTATQDTGFAEPISGGKSRATKKPFGIYVSPGHSPISPERFTGFHTGADFETTPEEQQVDVPISAMCNGPLILKKYAGGYGGIAVQSCTISGQKVTVLYGHLRLSSINPAIGDEVKTGQQIAVLGTGYSAETDGERKHLHVSIHKGAFAVLSGYVQKQSELAAWIDPMIVLP
jgi:murein DD-endopeptidase MepM/ murein hydrolase activator NlpD